MNKSVDSKQLLTSDNRRLARRLADSIANMFKGQSEGVTYVVKRLPINEHQVFRALYPRKNLADEPEVLIQRRLVVVHTSFSHVGYFCDLARLLRNKGIACGLFTDLPLSIEASGMAMLESFGFCFFSDRYILDTYPFAKQAARSALDMVGRSELAFLPKLGSLGYLEMRVDEDNLPFALMALSSGKESFTFCETITEEAKAPHQFKALVSCPRHLEVKVQETTQNPEIIDDHSENIKVTRVYWLTGEQLLGQLQRKLLLHAPPEPCSTAGVAEGEVDSC